MPGVETILGRDPLPVAIEKVKETTDKDRRKKAKERVDFYCDRIQGYLYDFLMDTFQKPEVRKRLEPFVPAAAGVNLFKRIVDEIAGPAYSAPPRRRVTGDDGGVYAELLKQCDYDAKQDATAHLAEAANECWHYYRASDRLGLIMQVLTPDITSAIPDPDDPMRELALIFDCYGDARWYRYWDREVTFEFTAEGEKRDQKPTNGGWPFVSIRRRGRWANLHDFQTGSDRVGLQYAASTLIILALKLHKSQGFRQPIVTGDVTGVPKDQTLDEESFLVAPEGATISTLDLKSDAGHYMDTLNSLVEMTASNYGISRDRLNQKTASPTSDTGLIERRRDIIRVCRKAEHDDFAVIKEVSKQFTDPSRRVPVDAKLEQVDFAELSDGGDMSSLLDIWEKQRAMALRNPLQNIMALNPEITTEEQAAEILERNIQINEIWIDRLKRMTAKADASFNGGGQTPEENGAMGPKVRDEKMSRDEAAERAEGVNMRKASGYPE